MRAILFINLIGLISSWEIYDNAYRSYFNLAGKHSEELAPGTKILVNEKVFSVILAQNTDGEDSTFVQLDDDHGATVGDQVQYAGAAATRTLKKKPEEGGFSPELPFSEADSVDAVKLEVQEANKPAMVIVTQPWCGACKALKTSVNGKADPSSSLHGLMMNFVNVHAAAEAGVEWQAPGESESYIPRVYFLDRSGEFMPITGPNENYKHFFSTAEALEKGMRDVLKSLSMDHDEL